MSAQQAWRTNFRSRPYPVFPASDEVGLQRVRLFARTICLAAIVCGGFGIWSPPTSASRDLFLHHGSATLIVKVRICPDGGSVCKRGRHEEVHATLRSTGKKVAGTTNGRGKFEVQLRPGRWTVVVNCGCAIGYGGDKEKKQVALGAQQTVRVRFTFDPCIYCGGRGPQSASAVPTPTGPMRRPPLPD